MVGCEDGLVLWLTSDFTLQSLCKTQEITSKVREVQPFVTLFVTFFGRIHSIIERKNELLRRRDAMTQQTSTLSRTETDFNDSMHTLYAPYLFNDLQVVSNTGCKSQDSVGEIGTGI